MKNLILLCLAISPLFAKAQTTGKIVYEEHYEFKIELPPEMQQYAAMLPTEQKTSMDLFFNAEESLYKASPVIETTDENPFEEGNGFNIKIGMGENAITYLNHAQGELIKAEDMMGKKFLIVGELEKPAWKILGNQREILGYQCLEATLQEDSVLIHAWFATEIPTAVGPMEMYGLPGAILAMTSVFGDDQNMSVTATAIELGDFNNEIEKPSKGKKVSQEEFDQILREREEEMEKMYGGEDHESDDGTTRIKIIRQ